ncbi:MAG: hypothetical protein D6736_14895 [Nitrospinota bacterium]|nr:MAG: hypothetical protein D6736_14895 [Nitrospinota bacterium]
MYTYYVRIFCQLWKTFDPGLWWIALVKAKWPTLLDDLDHFQLWSKLPQLFQDQDNSFVRLREQFGLLPVFAQKRSRNKVRRLWNSADPTVILHQKAGEKRW